MNIIKHYDAYLTYQPLPAERIEAIRNLFDALGLEASVDTTALEFEFVGRDLSDTMATFSKRLAKLLTNADGEIRCKIDDDDEIDPRFEFFTINSGKLWRQSAKIVRSGDVTEIS